MDIVLLAFCTVLITIRDHRRHLQILNPGADECGADVFPGRCDDWVLCGGYYYLENTGHQVWDGGPEGLKHSYHRMETNEKVLGNQKERIYYKRK